MKPVLLNNTVLRDGHQSLAATRMTTEQMLPAAPVLDGLGLAALETWGGATIDSCLRFLRENPFSRLDRLKAAAGTIKTTCSCMPWVPTPAARSARSWPPPSCSRSSRVSASSDPQWQHSMIPPSAPPPPAALPDRGWDLRRLQEVDSTQRVAAGLPAWSAVTAVRQTGGRGQRERRFTSDPGGLYLTAVVPFDGDAAGWRGFALAIGRGVMNALTELGIEDLRLRWPNDLMIGPRKAGGILVEQGGPHTLLVGLGLNITNRPWLEDHTLRYVAGRLLDHSQRALIGPAQVLEPMLEAIRSAHAEFAALRLSGMAEEINRCWGTRRHVWLEAAPDVDLPETEGAFAGIDETGHVLMARPDGTQVAIPEHHIQRLVEVE